MERRVAEFLLAGDAEPFATLQRQWAKVRVVRRRHSDDGLDVDLQVPMSVPRASPRRLDLSDVHLVFNDGSAGHAFMFVHDGALVQLTITNAVPPWRSELQVQDIVYARMIEPPSEEELAEFVPIAARDWPAMWQQIDEARSWPVNR